MSDNTRCCICYEEKPPFGFEKWTCKGHNDSICKECSNNCSNCPLCRAEPKMKIIRIIDKNVSDIFLNLLQNILNDNVDDSVFNIDNSEYEIRNIYVDEVN